MPQPILDLDKIYERIWDLLSKGAKSAKSDYHNAYLATCNKKNARLRTIILRKTLRDENSLIFHTDRRSSKVKEIRNNPSVSLLFYSKENKLQIRIEGHATLYSKGELYNMQWKNSKPMSRRCYLIEPGPGTYLQELSGGIPLHLKDRAPTDEESKQGKKNFCVVKIKSANIEWLNLHSEGHVRAKFVILESGYSADWLMP